MKSFMRAAITTMSTLIAIGGLYATVRYLSHEEILNRYNSDTYSVTVQKGDSIWNYASGIMDNCKGDLVSSSFLRPFLNLGIDKRDLVRKIAQINNIEDPNWIIARDKLDLPRYCGNQ